MLHYTLLLLFQWLENCFLGYLEEWQQCVDKRKDFTKGEKQMMCLSRETLEGLKIMGYAMILSVMHYFTNLSRKLIFNSAFICGNGKVSFLKKKAIKCLFSEKFCQDPVEAFFGRQHACGGWNVKQFLDNTVSLRVQSLLALDPVRGNC